MKIWGMLDGRERHVLPEADGRVLDPPWLDGLPAQRMMIREQIPALLGPSANGAWLRAGRVAAGVAVHTGGFIRDRITTWDRDTASLLARRLRLLCESLGPTYIKLGQVISGGPGLFPELLVKEFESCRDRVPPFGFEEVRRVLAEDLPGGVQAFADFDPEPFAAASIAQVHHAVLMDGQEVVVKVQRPGIAEAVQADLKMLSALAHQGLKRSKALHMVNPLAVLEYFAETVLEELDFRLEAENQLDVREACTRSEVADGVAVPRPHHRLVARRVLTMERLHGFPYSDSDGARAAGVDTETMLRAGFLCFIEGAMVHGVFHGDLHGGNIMVCPDGRYGILDYGIVGRLSPQERAAFVRMMASITTGDVSGQFAAIRDMGGIPPGADIDALAADFGEMPFMQMRMPTAAEIAEFIRRSLQVMMRSEFRLPKLLVLLSKNLIFLDDAVARFAPGFDVMAEAGHVFLRLQESLTAEEA